MTQLNATDLRTTHPHLHAWLTEVTSGDPASMALLCDEISAGDGLDRHENLVRLYHEHSALASRSGRWDLASRYFGERRPVDDSVRLEHELSTGPNATIISLVSRRGRA